MGPAGGGTFLGCRCSDNAEGMTDRLADELDGLVRLLRRLLDWHLESARDLEAVAARLLNPSWTGGPGQCEPVAKQVHELLTTQEHRVLEQICRARTNRQIASRLGISEKTAKNYVQAVFRKLRVHSRTEAVLLAARHQWFETGDGTATTIPRQPLT